ncbi:MAG: helix-turn-helix domain-containing protein [Candidatus Omnitrophica bacterium]|nr:helix-turn-helix domain-containing protein [Candidatus Omnitrophota bacterium]
MMQKFLTSREAADYLGIPESDLTAMSNAKNIPSYKIGGIYTRFKVDDLDVYRRRSRNNISRGKGHLLSDRIKDFFYFNDFYIFSVAAIAVILYFIFK